MSYFIRKFVTAGAPTLQDISREVAQYGIQLEPLSGTRAQVRNNMHELAELEVNDQNEDMFSEELEEFSEFAASGVGDRSNVLRMLGLTTHIIAIRVLLGGRSTSEVMDDIASLLGFVNAAYSGLMQADGEGFYDNQNLILEIG